MKKCTKCGGEISDNQNYCIYCGTELETEQSHVAQQSADINTHESPVGNNAPASDIKIGKAPKASLDGSQMLISAVVVVIVVLISFVGGKMLAKWADNLENSDIIEYNKSISEYKPGTIKNGTYASDYWGIKIKTDEYLTLASEEVMKEDEDELRKIYYEQFEEEIASSGIDDEEADMLLDSIYVNTEFKADYYSDDGELAEISMWTIGMYGFQDMSQREVAESLLSAYSDEMSVVTIAGKKFDCAFSEVEGTDISIKGYVYFKDGKVLWINCFGNWGFPDEVSYR